MLCLDVQGEAEKRQGRAARFHTEDTLVNGGANLAKLADSNDHTSAAPMVLADEGQSSLVHLL